MTAENVRKIALDVKEANAISLTTASSRGYDIIVAEIIKVAKKGGCSITINMSNVHYSVFMRLVGNGYFIADEGTPGFCIVSW